MAFVPPMSPAAQHSPASPARRPSQTQVFSMLDKAKAAASLSWTDLTYAVSSKAGQKTILGGITGDLRPGKLTCILGPSGAGKTTFMNILAGRVAAGSGSKVGGSVTLNGNTVEPHKYSHLFGYVMQEDSLFATSTPREVMEFSARLRLNDIDHSKLPELLTDMLESLGLSKCADTVVGNELIKGISGGEKKRTAVGAELMTNPKITFLDEPTSGLDSSAAYTVISLLKQLTDLNQSVMCTIHQPSSEIFALFDCAIFLARGKVVYQGPPSGIRDHFAKLGHQCPMDYNPADFVMHLLQQIDDDEMKKITEAWDKEAAAHRGADKCEPMEIPAAPKRKGFMAQLGLLSLREMRNVFRDKASLGARFGIATFLSLLFGVVFWQVGDSELSDYSIVSHIGGVTMVGISGMFGAAQPTLLSFPSERPVFLREHAARMYSTVPYFISKSMVELPLIFATSAISIGICYPMLGLVGSFISLLLASFLVGAASASLALLVGCVISDVKTVQEMTPILFVPQILFAGFFVKLSQVPAFLRWVQYICTLKWGMNVVFVTEFDGTAVGKQFLLDNDVEPDNVLLYLLILVGLFLLLRVAAMLVLGQKAKTVY